MEKEAAFPKDFPTDGVELRCFLVVSDYTRSLGSIATCWERQ